MDGEPAQPRRLRLRPVQDVRLHLRVQLADCREEAHDRHVGDQEDGGHLHEREGLEVQGEPEK